VPHALQALSVRTAGQPATDERVQAERDTGEDHRADQERQRLPDGQQHSAEGHREEQGEGAERALEALGAAEHLPRHQVGVQRVVRHIEEQVRREERGETDREPDQRPRAEGQQHQSDHGQRAAGQHERQSTTEAGC
jgi:hypothetical protein